MDCNFVRKNNKKKTLGQAKSSVVIGHLNYSMFFSPDIQQYVL